MSKLKSVHTDIPVHSFHYHDAIINIKDLRLRTYIGFNPEELSKQQDIIINAEIQYQAENACSTDDETNALNYKTITKQIIQQRTVPELICLKLATARFMLESSQLNFDAYEDASVIDLEEAFIYKQTPDPGTSVKSGDYVKLFLTLEQPLACDEDDELPEIDPLEDN